MNLCPLCGSCDARHFYRDKHRDYEQCQVCCLVFVPPLFHLNPEEEKAHYDLHENNPEDAGYRQFLGRLFAPLSGRLQPGDHGLDFGSGPGPTLSIMFAEAGYDVSIYDIFYAPDTSVLDKTYQFITATELVEHLSQPGNVLNHLWQILMPGGWLGLMTKQVLSAQAFASWHYKNDPTHISFFSRESFQWLGQEWGGYLEFVGNDVVLFQKPLV